MQNWSFCQMQINLSKQEGIANYVDKLLWRALGLSEGIFTMAFAWKAIHGHGFISNCQTRTNMSLVICFCMQLPAVVFTVFNYFSSLKLYWLLCQSATAWIGLGLCRIGPCFGKSNVSPYVFIVSCLVTYFVKLPISLPATVGAKRPFWTNTKEQYIYISFLSLFLSLSL